MRKTQTKAFVTNLLPEKDPKETFGSVELSLYAGQDPDIYKQCIVPTARRLAKRVLLGTYTPEIGQSAFYPTVMQAALKYEYEHGDIQAAKRNVVTCFDYEDRKDAALLLLHAYADLIKGYVEGEAQ